MHTYVKNSETYEDYDERHAYTVGQWLPSSIHADRTIFVRLFDVVDLFAAIALVNVLNGGGGALPDDRLLKMQITKEH